MKLRSAVGLCKTMCVGKMIRVHRSVAPDGSQSMCLLDGLDEFVHDHGPHGILTADATATAWNGYFLTVVCRCGWCLSAG